MHAALAAAAAGLLLHTGTPAPTTIGSFPGAVWAVGFDGSRLAWLEQTWELRVRPAAGGRVRTLRYTSQYEEVPGPPPAPRLLLARGRLLWLSVRGAGMGGLRESVYTDGAGRLRRLATQVHLDNYSGYTTPIAGDSRGFAYGVVEIESEAPACEPCIYHVTGGVWTVDDGIARAVPGAPAPALLARADALIALAPADTAALDEPEVRPLRRVEVRAIGTGAVAAAFATAGTPLALAFGDGVVAVLEGPRLPSYPRALEWFDARDGARRGSVPVPRTTAFELDASGTRIVFHDGHTISSLDTATGRVRVLHRAGVGWSIADVALSGARIVWGETRRTVPGMPTRRTAISRILSTRLV